MLPSAIAIPAPPIPCSPFSASMHSQTLKQFGTLEVLCNNGLPFLWETESQGEFDLWNLLVQDGFVQATDWELAIAHWQQMEQWGAPTDLSGYEYAPPRSERKDQAWTDAIAKKHQSIYQALQQFLQNNLTELQAYRVAVPDSGQFEWGHPPFSIHVIVAKLPDQQWLCLAPSVPDQVGISRSQTQLNDHKLLDFPIPPTDPIPSQLSQLLSELQPLTLFGYYYGGYNYEYQHQILAAVAPSPNSALVQALMAAHMLRLTALITPSHQSAQKTPSRFMKESLQHCCDVGVSFWDLGYGYTMGQTTEGDWMGIRYSAEFEYNP